MTLTEMSVAPDTNAFVTASEERIIALALALGAETAGGPLSESEQSLFDGVRASGTSLDHDELDRVRATITSGSDPLGALLYELRGADERRGTGTVYTPDEIVRPMVTWVLAQHPARVVDAGAGSGRYTSALLRAAPELHTVSVDLDPLATIMTRAIVAVLNAPNALVVNADFTRLRIGKTDGQTAFIGNPPYLRHHQLDAATKEWAQKAAALAGVRVSGLAGLHALFFLATARLASAGDFGCYVTSAEWLDVNYGSVIRNLLTDSLGGLEIHVIEPEALPFEGTQTTAAITQFRVRPDTPAIGFSAVPDLKSLGLLTPSTAPVARHRLVEADRWSVFLRTRTQVPHGYVELGEIARVHRGAVTGSNKTWVARGEVDLPESVLYASITKARELFAAGGVLSTTNGLRSVIDIPADLDSFSTADKRRIQRYLAIAKGNGVHEGYVASHRKAWWAIGLRKPAPILATYMARRPPAFVRNLVEARHINISHGIYPRQELSTRALQHLADGLSTSVVLAQGRTYAGGLTKFEPREMERLFVPDLDSLISHGETSPTMGR